MKTAIKLLVLTVGCTLCPSMWMLVHSQVAPRKETTFTRQPGDEERFFGWIKEPWIADDCPYIKIRAQLDKALKDKRFTQATLDKARTSVLQRPADPKAQFRWAYAVYQARYAGIALNEQQVLQDVRVAFASIPSPRSYQYARLRFLVEGAYHDNPAVKVGGMRLLRRNSKDHEVKFFVIRLLSTGSAVEQKQALSYAQELVRLYPLRATSHSALARVYVDRWNRDHNSADADKSITEYRKYVDLAPPRDPSRKRIEYLIQIIEQEKVERAKGS